MGGLMSNKKTRNKGAEEEARQERKADRAALNQAAKRAECIESAQEAINQSGYMLMQVLEKLKTGTVHIDDVIVLQGVAATVNKAGGRVAQALKTMQVEVATPEDAAKETGEATPVSEAGIIITG
jgi:hypothetical protein